MEGAGTVHAVGSEVSAWKPGDRVIFGVRPGAFAEYAKVSKPGGLMRLPDGWSEIEGAGYRVAAHTAYHSLVHRAAGRRATWCWSMARPGASAWRPCNSPSISAPG
jgi:NADPH2:quinone reductase